MLRSSTTTYTHDDFHYPRGSHSSYSIFNFLIVSNQATAGRSSNYFSYWNGAPILPNLCNRSTRGPAFPRCTDVLDRSTLYPQRNEHRSKYVRKHKHLAATTTARRPSRARAAPDDRSCLCTVSCSRAAPSSGRCSSAAGAGAQYHRTDHAGPSLESSLVWLRV